MPETASKSSPAQVVENVYRAFESQDIEALFGCFDEAVVISQSEDLPWGGTYHGLEEAMGFFATLTSYIETRVEVERFVVAGDTVVEVGRTSGRAISTGNEFSIEEVHVFAVKEGKVVRMDAYVDNAAMLEAISVD